jgi:hypothetical protein
MEQLLKAPPVAPFDRVEHVAHRWDLVGHPYNVTASSLPDAIVLVVAEMIEADAAWTFDRRWHELYDRVAIP